MGRMGQQLPTWGRPAGLEEGHWAGGKPRGLEESRGAEARGSPQPWAEKGPLPETRIQAWWWTW